MNLFSWLSRHPLKGPADMDRSRFTAEVMTKIKAEESPAPAPSRIWMPWPRLAWTLATVAAGILIMMSVTHQAPRQLAQPPQPVETVVLAESPATASEDQWLDETLQLLDELDEDAASGESAGNGSDDEWMQELESLDEAELAANS